MTNPLTFPELIAAGPILLVAFTAIIVLLVESFQADAAGMNSWISTIGLLGALVASLAGLGTRGAAFNGMVTTGGSAAFFAVAFCGAGALTVMLSHSYNTKEGIEHGEYYALVLFAVAGMMLMAAAADLIIFFLGLELMSVCFYVLAGFARKRLASNEAAIKYFLLGAFATGFLLYGIALLYGATGTTNIEGIVSQGAPLHNTPLYVIGFGMILVGLAFKVAAAPFHMWAPDVYEGAPTTVSGFMATGGKAAAFSGFLILLAPGVIQAIVPLRDVVAVIAALSMVVGNMLAIAQSSVKRMLAYSSIAHAGYILTGVVAANTSGSNGVLFYVMAYTMMNIGAFGVVSVAESIDGKNVTFDEYAGLSARKPLLAGLMALFMFSLAGVPPFAGFFGKYYVFAGAVQAGFTWLAIIGVLMSIVSAYYYLRLVVLMYFREQVSAVDADLPPLGLAALIISAIGIVVLGVYPSLVLNLMAGFY